MLIAELILACVLAFMIGSIPTGFIAGKMRGIDVRQHGSGNIGATNILRLLGKKWGICVLLIDALKGFFVVTLFSSWFFSYTSALSPSIAIERSWPHEIFHVVLAAFVIAGHVLSVFLCFKGGKGVATTLGVLFGIDWLVAIIAIVVFGVVIYFSRYVSLGSLLGITSATIASLVLQRPASSVIFILFAAIIIWIRHRDNIARIRNGTERKLSFKKKNATL